MDSLPVLLAGVAVAVGGTVLAAVLCRELLCWYWKMNEVLALLRSIDASLRLLSARVAPQSGAQAPYGDQGRNG
jgi:hypothetical protein